MIVHINNIIIKTTLFFITDEKQSRFFSYKILNSFPSIQRSQLLTWANIYARIQIFNKNKWMSSFSLMMSVFRKEWGKYLTTLHSTTLL